MHRYDPATCISFRKTKETYGAFSNMAGGYPIQYKGVVAKTSEALYQACRFPDHPEIREAILNESSPMAAKFVAKKHLEKTRVGWDSLYRVSIMRWAVSLKILQHLDTFGVLLLSTEDKPIVEDVGNRNDMFWGAKIQDGIFVGENVLGRLLMALRSDMINNTISDKPPEDIRICL